VMPKSLTFVPAKLDDNPTLAKGDPSYRANLMAMELVERERLLGGNWKVRPAAGLKFPRDKWQYADSAPKDMQLCRFWDKAATEGGTGARTAGVLMGRAGHGPASKFYVIDCVCGRWGDLEREEKIRSTAELDRASYGRVVIGMEQEPGSGGKDSALATIRALAGYEVYAEPATGEKGERWSPMASQQQAGSVYIVKGPWDWVDYVRELDSLSGDKEMDKSKLKDRADASAGAFKHLAHGGLGTTVSSILASGEDDGAPFTPEEIEELPEGLRDLLRGGRDDEDEYD
jgi:phage terminase large subunit-like protein